MAVRLVLILGKGLVGEEMGASLLMVFLNVGYILRGIGLSLVKMGRDVRGEFVFSHILRNS